MKKLKLNLIILSLTIVNKENGLPEVVQRETIEQNPQIYCDMGFEYLFEKLEDENQQDDKQAETEEASATNEKLKKK